MISRLPNWVWVGGWLLTSIAGFINAVGFLGLSHEAVTHLTGTATALSIAVTAADIKTTTHLLMLVGAFFGGSIFSGFIIQQSTLQLGRRYGLALFIESLLIILAIPLLMREFAFGYYLLSFACGLQNAMASSYSGAVIRTTHISGMVTDMGIILGHWLRRLPPDLIRFKLYATMISGFVLGSMIGAVLFQKFSYAALSIPAAMTGGASIAYTIYTFKKKN